MRFVFDANILMAVLIGGRAFHKVIVDTFDIVTPDFALTEINMYSSLIVQKSRLDRQSHSEYAQYIFSRLTVLPAYLIGPASRRKATELIGDIDSKDISYVALAIELNLILVTRDKPIVEAARKRGFRRIMLYDEFLRQYS